MRDRLIELLRKPTQIWDGDTVIGERKLPVVTAEELADHLLANGVIIPPCKVGDTVYQVMDIESVHRLILEIKILSIEITDTTIFFSKTIKKYRYNYGKFGIDDFGKTVFLTREAAEQALKEREQG